MNPIGGYFELELGEVAEYHMHALRLNTGRNALELILKIRQYEKVFIPYYTCDVILEPFKKLNIKYEFYSIDEYFQPLFNYGIINKNEAFLYTNYFGLKDVFITKLSAICPNLIIDNSQSFYSKPLPGIDTFYSPRKFFGLSDGAYLYTDGQYNNDFDKDKSSERFNHLLRRIEDGAENGYSKYFQNEEALIGQPIKLMSNLTHRLLRSIDYEAVASKRRNNFNQIHNVLGSRNVIKIDFHDDFVPLVYPFLYEKKGLRRYLIQNKIYLAQYWPNVLNWCQDGTIERKYTQYLLSLPIDQRYSKNHMESIIKMILNYV
jgi:hypothetical protein